MNTKDTLRCPNTLTACPPPHVCDHHCRGTEHWCRDCEMRFLAKPTVATEEGLQIRMMRKVEELKRSAALTTNRIYASDLRSQARMLEDLLHGK